MEKEENKVEEKNVDEQTKIEKKRKKKLFQFFNF
jgi:hypothetical protein